MNTALDNTPPDQTTVADILSAERRGWARAGFQGGLIVLVILGCTVQTGLADWQRLSEGVPAMMTLFGDMIPPDFSSAEKWIVPILDTLAMSIAGTALAVGLSLPLGFLAARNTAPNPTVYWIAKGTLNFLRAVPELIMGIVFVAAVGFGALQGVLALGLHSVGMIGKFFAENIEHAHPAPVEAARAAGGSELQVITHGIMPQVMPHFADVIMYRWEYNFRTSTVMGMVGAGGIGLELMGSLRIMQYNEVLAILIVILAMVTLVDGASALLRHRFK